MRQFLSFFLLLLTLSARAETPAQANKRLFDKTVDELNFRTFETVYDKSFTRGKFPVTLRSAQARKQFTQFGDNKGLQQLFQNYNAIAERFKGRFGRGPMTLAEFEKQLNSILLDKNFEFFIRGLPRDERVALIRAEQRLIKQAAAQFNAAGADETPALPDATADAQPEAPVTAPLTTNGDPAPTADAPEPDDVGSSAEAPLTSTGEPAPARSSGGGWSGTLTLLLTLANTLMLAYLLSSALPALRRRVNALTPDPEPEPEAPTARSLFNRLRAPRPAGGFRDDRYEDDEDDEPAPRHDDEDDR